MSRNVNPPSPPTLVEGASKQQLADLATLLGLMQSASKLSQELDVLANQVGARWRRLRSVSGCRLARFMRPSCSSRARGR